MDNFTKCDIERYLSELNDELAREDTKGEICIYGGAMMCLAFDARPSTKDVDAIFKPETIIRRAAELIATRHNLRGDWLNDALKGFLVAHNQNLYVELSNLRVFLPDPEYLLAMKAMAARVDASDKDDIIFLIERLGIESADKLFSIIEAYYPHNRISPAAQFFIEEIFESGL